MNPIRPKYILTLLVVCLAFSGLVFANGGGRADLPDSILTEDHIYKYLYTDRSKSERIMAEMRPAPSRSGLWRRCAAGVRCPHGSWTTSRVT